MVYYMTVYSYTIYLCIMYAYLWVYLRGNFHTSCCARPDAKFTLGPAELCSYVWYFVSRVELYVQKISPGHTIQLSRIPWHRSVSNPGDYILVVVLACIYIYRWVKFTWKLCQALRCVEVCKYSGIQVAQAPKSIRLTISALGLKFSNHLGSSTWSLYSVSSCNAGYRPKLPVIRMIATDLQVKRWEKYLFSTFAVGGGAGDRRRRQTELDCSSSPRTAAARLLPPPPLVSPKSWMSHMVKDCHIW